MFLENLKIQKELIGAVKRLVNNHSASIVKQIMDADNEDFVELRVTDEGYTYIMYLDREMNTLYDVKCIDKNGIEVFKLTMFTKFSSLFNHEHN